MNNQVEINKDETKKISDDFSLPKGLILDLIETVKLKNGSFYDLSCSITKFMADMLEMKSEEEYYSFLHDAQQGMELLGGSFSQILGLALLRADAFNQAKIVVTFYGELKEHADLYKKKFTQLNN